MVVGAGAEGTELAVENFEHDVVEDEEHAVAVEAVYDLDIG